MTTMSQKPSILHIFFTFLKLGCTAFGGPIAHLAYFHKTLIQNRQWISPDVYANLISLCHFIPGPSSSQTGLAIGYTLHGWKGAVLAWAGFTLPSAVLMALLAVGLLSDKDLLSSDTIHYLKIIALAVVVQALWQMSQTLLIKPLSRCLCLIACGVTLLVPGISTQIIVLLFAGISGSLLLRPEKVDSTDTFTLEDQPQSSNRKLIFASIVFISTLLMLPLLSHTIHTPLITLFDSLYRTGALVFGGGHVVLPLLQQEVIQHSSISSDSVLAGYSLAQALPGPLFTFATYIGALWIEESPWLGAMIGTIAIFLPSFILVPTLLPHWQKLHYNTTARGVASGFNAAVIGFLLAVLYQPLFISTITSAQDVTMTLAVFVAMNYLKIPAWTLVLFVAITGILIT